MEKNKFSKYLIYAIGEILLVVIGILIALQLNTCDGNKIIAKKEEALLREMTVNLKVDLIDLKYNINRNKNKLKANEIVLNSLIHPSAYNDSLDYYYANIQGNTVFVKNTSAYDNLKSIGFNIIKNDYLRMLMTNLYSNQYDYIRYLEQNRDEKFQFEQILPNLAKNIVNDSTEYRAHPINYSELIINQEFKEMLKINLVLRRRMISTYESIETTILILIAQIEKELKRR